MANRTVSVNLVANIGQYVGGMNTAAAATMRLGETANSSSRTARSAFDIAGKGAVLMGAAVVGGMALAVSKSMEFEKAMSAAAAATMVTGAALGDLRDAAMKAGADTQYSATEAAQAITEMGKAGVSTADILHGGLNGALSLAAAGQIEVAKAAEIASVAMTQFKLSGDQLPHVADLLAAGAGKAMGSVEDLGMALNQAGLVASSTGLSIEETTGTLAAFASAGLIGSDAGTSFRSMLQHLQNPSKESAAAMAELGINMYDAQGNFVGMEGLAGQLKTSMNDLTPAVRDAAMAQIFGSDAVRAANVLYAEGAAGIARWTAKVNDQGYAAEQAAKLNDNLAGDLERLGGAFDTLMIGMGSGAQGPLRALVQGFTAILDGATSLGGPLKALGGFIADNTELALALAAAMAVQLAGGITAVNAALARFVVTPALIGLGGLLNASLLLGPALSTAARAVAGFVVAAAPLVAVGAVVYAISKTIDFATAAGDAREEIRGMWDAVDDARGAEQINALSGYVDQLTAKVRSLNAELPKTEGAFEGLLAPLGMLENGGTLNALDEYEAALTRAKEQQVEVERTAGRMGDRFGLTRDQVLDLASKYDIDLTGSMSETFRLMQNYYAMEFGAKPTEATIGLATAMVDAEVAIDDAKKAVDGFKLSLDILTGANVSMIQVESAFEAAVAEADGALKDMTGSVLNASGGLNMQSESGRAAADVLLDVRDSGNQLIATMIEQGATADEVKAKDAQLRDSFVRSAMQMGISEAAALELANQILGIPAERESKIDADVQAALDKIDQLQREIDGLKGRTVEVQVRAAGRFVVNPQGGLQEFANGGWTGPGSKYTPAGIVHADEFVVPKDRVNALGGPRRVGSLVGMPGYADGGPVLPIGYTHDTRSLEATMGQVANAMRNATKGPGLGAVGGAWGSLWQLVKSQIPSARMNSTFRAGDPGYHGLGKAIDFGYGPGPGGAGSAGLAAINRLLHDQVGGNLAELIYDGIGDDRPDLKNGRPLTYSAGTRAAHRNHVHAAVYDQGGPLRPGYTLAYNGTGKTEWVSKEFSGGGSSGGRPTQVVVSIEGAQIAGTLEIGGDGLGRIIDGRIVSAVSSVNDGLVSAGVRP